MKLAKFVTKDTAVKIVENKTVFFSSPLAFNDPFDVRESLIGSFLDYSSLCTDLKSAIMDAVSAPVFVPMYSNRLSDRISHFRHKIAAGDKKIQDVVDWLDEGELEIQIRQSNEKRDSEWRRELEACRVFCLTEVDPADSNESCTMWSHYSENHTGVALVFDPAKWFGDKIHKVRYAGACPLLTSNNKYVLYMVGLLETFLDADFERVFATKASCWSYEKEWRVVASLRKDNNLIDDKFAPFDPLFLEEVIFGCRVEDSFVRDFTNLVCREIGSHVKCSRLCINKREFSFNRQEIS